MRLRLVFAAACTGIAPLCAHAQLIPSPVGAPLPARIAASAGDARDVRDDSAQSPKRIHLGPISIPRRDSSWWVPVASAVLPGTGQALLGQNRFIAYLAVEGFAVLGYFDQHNEQLRERNRFQALAANVARSSFAGSQPTGPWAYYELLEHWKSSGVFDLVPGGTFTPEVDITTYNGAAWLLARQTYWNDPNVQPAPDSPEYRKALAFYIARAVQPQFRWSWQNAQLEQDVYIQSIEHANQAARDARFQLGILIANHLLSMVDAYVTLRVHGGLGAPGSPTSLVATIPWAPFGRPSSR
ncbi:MAG TPA: hypothetical protein VGQ30_12940 [Gemmatimonadaceae bacterium]|nr:hypothetical protein [Gemmatimonadaceae bacterium]